MSLGLLLDCDGADSLSSELAEGIEVTLEAAELKVAMLFDHP